MASIFFAQVAFVQPASAQLLSPSPLSPPDGSINQPTSVSLSWSAVLGAISYHLQVATDTSFAAPVVDITSVLTTTQTVGPLTNATTYFWRVSASDSIVTSAFSAPSSFTTVVAAPPAPTLSSPANGATNQPTSLTLSWNASTGASTYHVQLASDSSFTTIIVDNPAVATTSLAVGPLSNGTTYRWRVSATNAGGTSAFSTASSFTTVPAPPPVPTLVSPADGAANQPLNLTLSWNASAGAVTYHLQVSTSNTFATTVVDDSTISGTSAPLSSLANSTTYFWRVSAANAGGASAFSATSSFSTVPPAPPPPGLASPANGATNQPTSITLSWTASAGASTYHLQVSTSNTFAPLVADDTALATTSAVVGPLSTATTYFWRVSASNAGGTSAFSAISTFTTVPAAPPAPVLSSPANGAPNQPTTLTLGWNASTGASTYHLQVSTSNTFATTVLDDSVLTATSAPIGPLATSTTYFWRVSATNAGGTSAFSATSSFSTVPPVPATPTLSSPANGATNVPTSLTLTWNAATGASTYRVQVSTSGTFATTLVDDSTVTTASRAIGPLAVSTTYFWRVSATNAGGTSAFSSTSSFSTLPAVPAVPTLASPANGATNQPTSLTLSWGAAAGAVTYHLQVSTSNIFATTIVDDSTIAGTSAPVGPLTTSTTYFWRVSALNAGGTSAFSAASSFITVPAPPQAPTLASPANAATNQPTSLTLSWNAAAGASTYRIQLSTSNTFATTVLDDSAIAVLSFAVGPLATSTTYFWRVSATNSGGTSAFSATSSFTTVPAPPSSPSLSSPVNGATNQPTSLTLNWNASTGASTYRIQLSTSNTFATTVLDDSALAAVSLAVGPLATSTTYFWRVSATNAGGTSAFSASSSFTTVPAPPAIPVLSSPPNGAINQPTSLLLSWAGATGATTYRVQVSTSNTFATTIVDDATITSTSRAIGPLAVSTTYFWRVSATNPGGTSAFSTTASFTTLPAPPATPTLLTPTNGAINQATSLTLTWSGVSGAVTYRVQVSVSPTFSPTLVDDSTLTSTTRAISALSTSTTYFWRVSATNPGGTSAFSTTFSFTTVPAPPATPTLLTPANGATNQATSLALTWSAVSGTVTYRVQVSTTPTFASNLIDDSTLTTTTRAIGALSTSTTYFWRVSATNAGGSSAFSAASSFSTVPPAPASPSIVSPTNGAANQPLSLVVSWSASLGAVTYRVQISTSNTFATTIVDDSTLTTTSRAIGPLLTSTTYFWRVSATNPGGTSAFSTTSAFTTVPAPPATPTLASPGNAAINQPTSLTVAWNAVLGASTYRVQLSTSAAFATTIVDDSTLTTTSRAVGPLSTSTTYFWRVSATNPGGTSGFSGTSSFSTVPPPPSVPTNLTPITAATNQPTNLTLTWTVAAGAAGYRVQLSTNPAFTTIVLDDSSLVTTSRFVGPLTTSTTYYWRVSATNPGGSSGFSSPTSFTTVPPAPNTPTLASPSNLSADQPLSLVLSWNPLAGATSYHVQVSTNPSFTPTLIDDSSLTATSRAIGPLSTSTTYYWRVSGINAGGSGAYSSPWSFRTVPNPPLAPVLLSPPDGTTNVNLSPLLSWNAASGAVSYRVQVSLSFSFSTTIVDQAGVTSTSFALSGLLPSTIYYWRVSAANTGGTSTFSTASGFTTVPPVPQSPTLLSPSNSATNVSTSPTLSWSASPGAASYHVQVSLVPDFVSTVVDQSGISSTSFVLGGLSTSTNYYWRVDASNAGGTSSWPTPWSFTTVPNAPVSPVLSLPLNGATNVSISPTLSWNSTPGAISYRVQVSTDAGFTSTVVDQSSIATTSYTITALAPNTTFYWRVIAANSGGAGSWSAAWSFTTIPAAPPTPTLVSPLNGASGVSTSPAFSWNPVTGATSYHLQVSASTSFASPIIDQGSLAAPTFAGGSLAQNTTYYWRVSASNVGGTSNWSPAWSFTTVPGAPSPPILAAPVNGATDVSLSPTLRWDTTAGATTYHLQVSTASSFASPLVDQGALTSTFFAVTGLSVSTQYFWRVSASNPGGTSNWSSVSSFTTVPAAPASPTLLAPPDSATNVSLSPSLSWSASTGASSYRLQISTTSGFASPLIDQSSLTLTSYSPGGLLPNTIYYWRVEASNSGGTSSWSAPRSFRTIPNAPPGPVLLSPPNQAINVPTSTVLVWNPVSGSTSYHLQVALSGSFNTTFVDQTGLTVTSFSLSGLNPGTIYFWRVSASNPGGTGSWSDIWTFTTLIPIPSVPVLLSPPDGSVDQPINLTLSWASSNGSSSYRLQLSTDSSFASSAADQSGITATSYQPSGLLNGTAYYWRVMASSAGGSSAWSRAWRFTTIVAAPLPPSPVSPADGAANQPLTLALSWSSAPQGATYRLQVSSDQSFASLALDIAGLTTTTRQVGPLLVGTLYYWRVDATNKGGTSDWSAFSQFSTLPAAPGVPTLSSPATGSSAHPTVLPLTWNPVTGAKSYRLQVSTDPAFGSAVVDSSLLQTQCQVGPLSYNSLYYWRVSAVNAGGTGGWSTVWNFTTEPLSQGGPVLITPANGLTGATTVLVLRWNTVPTANSYELQVSESATFTSTTLDSVVIGTSLQIGALTNGSTYYWRVRANFLVLKSQWSNVWTFTIIPTPPPAPTLASPPNGAKNQPTTVILNWNIPVGADFYRVQLSSSAAFSTFLVDDSTLTAPQRQVGPLANGSLLYWRVGAKNLAGWGPWSTAWNFTVVPSLLAAPTLSTPADNSTNQPTSVVLNWIAQQGATAYDVEVAAGSSFVPMLVNDSTLTSPSLPLSSLSTSTLYFWRVRSQNSAGWGPFSQTWSFSTVAAALSAPVLASPPDGASNQSTTLLVSWNAITGASSYELQIALDSLYTSLVLDDSTVAGNTRQAGPMANGSTFYWRVRARGAGGWSAFSASWSFSTIPIQPTTITLSGSVAFPSYANSSEFKDTDYRIVGIPGGSGITIQSMIPGSSGTDWLAFWDNGQSTDYYVRYDGSSVFSFTVGKAFWLIKKGNWNINATVPSAQINASRETRVPLHSGWNLITNPFPTPLLWSQVQSLNSVSEPIYSFDGSFEISETFAPYVGYYFFNSSSLDSLRVPSGSVTGSARKIESSGTTATQDWRVQVVLTSRSGTDGLLWFGESQAAATVGNLFDYHKPRSVGSSPATYFRRPDWNPQYALYATDVRPNGTQFERWEFETHSSRQEILDLSFAGVTDIQPGLAVYLLDEQRRSSVDLRSSPHYAFQSAVGSSSFSILVGSDQEVHHELAVLTLPGEFQLGLNYPNPFNPSTTIPLDVPVRAEVTVRVFSALGQEVATLYSGMLDPGRHLFRWDGKDSGGQLAASGIYFCRLSTNSGVAQTRAMVLLK